MSFLKRLGYYLGGFSAGLIFLAFILNGKKSIVPTINEKNKIKNPIPKFLGNSTSDDNKYLSVMPPTKLPILFNAKPSPKKRPLCDLSVLWFKKSVHIGTIMPIAKA